MNEQALGFLVVVGALLAVGVAVVAAFAPQIISALESFRSLVP